MAPKQLGDVPAQIYQVYADQLCPSAEAGHAKAERIAAYHGIPIDTACVPADQATFANGTVVPYCDAAQPAWSAYRCVPRSPIADSVSDATTADLGWNNIRSAMQ